MVKYPFFIFAGFRSFPVFRFQTCPVLLTSYSPSYPATGFQDSFAVLISSPLSLANTHIERCPVFGVEGEHPGAGCGARFLREPR